MQELVIMVPEEKDIFVTKDQGLILRQDFEKQIAMFLKMRKRFDEAYQILKATIKNSANAIAPGWKGSKGDFITVFVKSAGDKYKVSDISLVPPEWLSFRVGSKHVDEYIKEHGDLPPGIVKNPSQSSTVEMRLAKES